MEVNHELRRHRREEHYGRALRDRVVEGPRREHDRDDVTAFEEPQPKSFDSAALDEGCLDALEIVPELGVSVVRAEREAQPEPEPEPEFQPGERRNGASTKLFEAGFQMKSLWAVTSP